MGVNKDTVQFAGQRSNPCCTDQPGGHASKKTCFLLHTPLIFATKQALSNP